MFRHFLVNTPGEFLVNFWLDIERFHSLPASMKTERYEVFRELQIKYFEAEYSPFSQETQEALNKALQGNVFTHYTV